MKGFQLFYYLEVFLFYCKPDYSSQYCKMKECGAAMIKTKYENLRIKEHLIILQEHQPVAFKAKLVCDCGCEKFKIYYTGKQTKGILSPHLVKKNKQIEIEAVCKNCGNKIIVLDTAKDGMHPHIVKKDNLKPFQLKGQDLFSIELSYNYLEDSYMTNQFVDCFIDVKNDNEKVIRIYE